jgi:hypothetical protein
MEIKFSQQTTKNNQISNFMTIHPVDAELFLGDKQTHRGTYRGTDERRDRQTEGHDETNSRFFVIVRMCLIHPLFPYIDLTYCSLKRKNTLTRCPLWDKNWVFINNLYWLYLININIYIYIYENILQNINSKTAITHKNNIDTLVYVMETNCVPVK